MKRYDDYTIEDLEKSCYPDGKDGDFVIDENFMKPIFYNTLEEKILAESKIKKNNE